MKKSVRIIAVAVALLMVTLALASCGRLSGTYVYEEDGVELTLKFKGDKVTAITSYEGETMEPEQNKYEIKDDEIILYYDDDGEVESEAASYEKTKDGIKIGGMEFKKQ